MNKTTEEIIRTLETLPILTRGQGLSYDPSMAVAFHESAHATVLLLHGFAPERASLAPPRVYPPEGIRDFHLLLRMYLAGCVGAAAYGRAYTLAGTDLALSVVLIRHLKLSREQVVDIWRELHRDLMNHWGILSLIASRLYREKEIDRSWFETVLSWS
jgi:hypothetical protein